MAQVIVGVIYNLKKLLAPQAQSQPHALTGQTGQVTKSAHGPVIAEKIGNQALGDIRLDATGIQNNVGELQGANGA